MVEAVNRRTYDAEKIIETMRICAQEQSPDCSTSISAIPRTTLHVGNSALYQQQKVILEPYFVFF